MSSTTTIAAMDRRTYWCHECDMSISLIPPSSDVLTCPHCNSDFLEELDSPITFTNHNHDIYFHNVINQLFNSNPNPNPTASGQNSQASKLAIESIPTVKITSQLLEMDPDIMCAVCKDRFLIDDETKELPCKHLYHPDCILPWLSQRNSCPVCRFQLPIEPSVDAEFKVRRRSRSRVLRFGDIMDHEIDIGNHNGNGSHSNRNGNDEELLGFGLRHLARRHRFVFPMRRSQFQLDGDGDGDDDADAVADADADAEVVFSPTQIGEEGDVSGRTDSVETVSSWPNWPVDIDGPDIADADVVMSS